MLFGPHSAVCKLDGMKATAILQQLDERDIRERIDEIDRERDALMVLLRAAMRKGKEPKQRDRQEGSES